MNNELILLQELLTEIEYPGTITLDMRKTAKHWFLGYDYYLIRMETLANDISKETCIADSYYGSQINDLFIDRANHNIEKSIKRYWSNEVEIGTIDVIAFTDKIVEKDSAIFYLYTLEGDNLGLYCHSMNWVEDIVYIGRSLNQFFDLKEAKTQLSNIATCKDFVLPKRKLLKTKTLHYSDVLESDEYLILDVEFGFIINFELYHKFIDEDIIPLTKGELGYTSLTPLSNDDVLKFIWLINDQEYLFELDNGSDGIDLRMFYDKLIEIQKNSGTQKNLVLFHDMNFGQEYGLAYIDKKTEKKLFSLFDIGVLER